MNEQQNPKAVALDDEDLDAVAGGVALGDGSVRARTEVSPRAKSALGITSMEEGETDGI